MIEAKSTFKRSKETKNRTEAAGGESAEVKQRLSKVKQGQLRSCWRVQLLPVGSLCLFIPWCWAFGAAFRQLYLISLRKSGQSKKFSLERSRSLHANQNQQTPSNKENERPNSDTPRRIKHEGERERKRRDDDKHWALFGSASSLAVCFLYSMNSGVYSRSPLSKRATAQKQAKKNRTNPNPWWGPAQPALNPDTLRKAACRLSAGSATPCHSWVGVITVAERHKQTPFHQSKHTKQDFLHDSLCARQGHNWTHNRDFTSHFLHFFNCRQNSCFDWLSTKRAWLKSMWV